jgi:hypothetical protein
VHPKGERDWPVDHPKAVDTPGNSNHLTMVAGVDPLHPEREQFTGRDPEKAKRMREISAEMSKHAQESLPRDPVVAPQPPAPGDISEPAGQPGR